VHMRHISALAGPDATVDLVWESDQSGAYDISVQRVTAAGGSVFPLGGVLVCGAPLNQISPLMVSDARGGLLVSWQDGRDGAADVYAQHVDLRGYWGLPGAEINAVRDVPGDQGGFVNLTFFASRMDSLSYSNQVSNYTLWRALPVAKTGARVIHSPADLNTDSRGPVVLAVPQGNKVLFWEYLETLTPFGLPAYGRVLATPYDSTAVYATPVDYMVITQTSIMGELFMSLPAGGISVDNLAPTPPLGLAGAAVYQPGGLGLRWHANAEADLDHYNLYRGATPGFALDAGSLVASVADTAYVDAIWQGTEYYLLTAVDVTGNESGAALLSPAGVSGVGDPAPRLVAAIKSIAPNPFNPATEISFAVPRQGHMQLEVHDLRGRRVRTLVDGDRAAGSYRVLWRGRDDTGRPMASGTYLCRLVTPSGAVSQAMTLVK